MRFFCFVFTLLILSCSSTTKERCVAVNIVENDYLKKWRADSTGCSGDRYQMINNNQIDLDAWTGVGVECLEKTLGKPDAIYSSQTDYVYFISCKYSPPYFGQDTTIISSEASLLVIYLDIGRQVSHYRVMIP